MKGRVRKLQKDRLTVYTIHCKCGVGRVSKAASILQGANDIEVTVLESLSWGYTLVLVIDEHFL